MNNKGVIYTSTIPAKTSNPMLISIKSNASIKTFLFPKLCFINAIEIIPPANPATKYAKISNTPWVIYLKKPKVAAPKNVPVELNNCSLITDPIAAAITEAFHVKINNAPDPYNKENIIQKNNTLILFKKIFPKWRYPSIAPPWTLALTF